METAGPSVSRNERSDEGRLSTTTEDPPQNEDASDKKKDKDASDKKATGS